MIAGLRMSLDNGIDRVIANADSELMIKQLNGEYKVKNPELKKLYDEVKSIERKFTSIKYQHVRREMNQRADALANLALDS